MYIGFSSQEVNSLLFFFPVSEHRTLQLSGVLNDVHMSNATVTDIQINNIHWALFRHHSTIQRKIKTWPCPLIFVINVQINKLWHSILNAKTHYSQGRKKQEVINSFQEGFWGCKNKGRKDYIVQTLELFIEVLLFKRGKGLMSSLSIVPDTHKGLKILQ